MTPSDTRSTPVSERLDLLSQAVEAATDRIHPQALCEAHELLDRAGHRMRLSSEHTVVALAGGTGSGKSSLFNAVSGLDLSRVAARRPTTSHTHACVWGLRGAGPLLDWLEIEPRYRYARTSILDRDESQLRGLVLLDLPDHDSIEHAPDQHGEAARVIGAADLIVWVLDPQKYADAAIHHRYITRFAGHDSVTVFVLNQADRLSPEDLVVCVDELRGLLKREGLDDPRIVTTSAVTGRGLDGLKGVLSDVVGRRRAAAARIEADIDRLRPMLEESVAPDVPDAVRPECRAGLLDALHDASGVGAVGERLENAHVQHLADWVGWPVARWIRRLAGDPLSRVSLPGLQGEIRRLGEGPAGAQPAEVDNAVRGLADNAGGPLPPRWRSVVRDTARRRSAELPEELSAALAEATPGSERVPAWWRLVMVWQYLLVVLLAVAVAWMAAVTVYGLAGLGSPPHPLLHETAALRWLGLVALCFLGLGLLTAVACRNAGVIGGGRERERLEAVMRERVSAVAETSVIEPVDEELKRYDRFRQAVYGLRGR